MNNVLVYLAGLAPTIITGIALYYMQRNQKRRDEEVTARAETRKEESFLHLELQSATADLSHAVACAVKRGKPNGEMEESIEAYEAAKDKYDAFMRKQVNEFRYNERRN